MTPSSLTMPARRPWVRWILALFPLCAIIGWHWYISVTVANPLVMTWQETHRSTLKSSRISLNRHLNRVVMTTPQVTEEQREQVQELLHDLTAATEPYYDLYTWLLPYRNEFRVIQTPTRISLPPPLHPRASSPHPQNPEPTPAPSEQSESERPQLAPESEEAARARRLAQLRWLALLEGVTIGTLYKEGVPHTSFSGTLFNRHEYALQHAIARLTLYAPDGQPAASQDFTLVPFVNPSVSISGRLPPKHRLPFSFDLSEPLPNGWTTRAELIVITFDEPPPAAPKTTRMAPR